MGRSIFDIDNELDKIAMAYDQLEETGEETAFLKAIENYFGDLIDERDKKLDAYARFMAERKSIADARKNEAVRLTALARTDENMVQRCKDRLKSYFDLNGISKIETPLHKFCVCVNGGKVPVQLTDVEPITLDKKYQKVEITIDTDAVRSDLESGVNIPWARLGERGTHLRVK